MATQQKITEENLIDFYMDAVVRLQGKPDSIESLGEHYDFDAESFYDFFKNFEELDRTIFKTLIDISLATLAETPDFESFDKKDKLLSLYYIFFENLTLNRDFVLITLKDYGLSLSTISLLSKLRDSFNTFVDSLQMETLNIGGSLESLQKKSIRESFWVQFLLTLKFWMSDDSPECETTDIFIEKSVNTGIELLNTKSLHNIIDLGKFLYNEKIKSKDV